MNKVYKAILSATATAIVAGASIVPANVLAWGDSSNGRKTYTLEEINAGDLGNTITMNSITNGKNGDERNFVSAQMASSNTNAWNANEITVKDGDVVTIRLYVHNNSPLGTNAIATGVSANISLPTTVSKEQTVIGYLNAANATPSRYWDEVKLVSSDYMILEYVEGSAKYTNTQGTFSLPDSIVVSEGAKLGYTSMNGEIPGCFEYDGFVTLDVKVTKALITRLSKTVRKAGTTDKFTEKIDAKVGDKVEFQIEYRNLSDADVDNVMIRDILPTNMEYVKDSTYLYNSNHQSGVKINENTLTTTGINIGNYTAKGLAYVRFTAKVVNKNLTCGATQMVNWANATVSENVVKDDASVMVNITDGCTKKEDEKKTDDKKSEDKKTDDKKTDTTETVTKIVSTGPAEIAGAAVGLGSIVTAGGYYIASRKKLVK